MSKLNMSIEEQAAIRKSLKLYLLCQSEEKQNEVRNQIYLDIDKYLIGWTKNILGKWKKYETPQEIRSLSWDVFLFCLKHYKPEKEITVPRHFYNYTKYFLLNKYATEGRVRLSLDELKDTIGLVRTTQNIAFENVLTIMQIRDNIPEKYKVVFDDAIQSCMPGNRNAVKSYDHNLSEGVYSHLKLVLKSLIKYIMDIKE